MHICNLCLMSTYCPLGLIRMLMRSTSWWTMNGCETWTMTKEEIDTLAACKMWIWRRMEKISWTEKRSSKEVLQLVGEERCMLEVIATRKKAWIGHMVRGHGLFKLIIEERMEGKRSKNKPKMGMMDDLLMGSYEHMKRSALDKSRLEG